MVEDKIKGNSKIDLDKINVQLYRKLSKAVLNKSIKQYLKKAIFHESASSGFDMACFTHRSAINCQSTLLPNLSPWYLMVFTLRRKHFLYERHGLLDETKGGGPRYPQNKHVRTVFCTVENTTKSLSLLKL